MKRYPSPKTYNQDAFLLTLKTALKIEEKK